MNSDNRGAIPSPDSPSGARAARGWRWRPWSLIPILLHVLPSTAIAQFAFSASVAPNPVTVQAGGMPVTVTVSTATVQDIRTVIVYSFTGFRAGIETDGSRSVAPPYTPQSFSFSAGASVPPGVYQGMLVGTTADGSLTVPVSVVVQAAPQQQPVVEALIPAAVSAGTRQNRVRITGRNFQAGAAVVSEHPGLRFLQLRVLSPTSAEAVVAVRPDLPPGRYGLRLRNPDGSESAAGPALMVHAIGSLAGPVAVTGVNVVSPRPSQVVARGESVYPRALLATTGMGTVSGTWLLDGVPFHRFTQVVSGGGPVEVRSPIPIPTSFTGEHSLELALESPRTLQPHGVSFLQAAERPVRLRFLVAAPDGQMGPVSSGFRWSAVPGASGYRVEIGQRPEDSAADARWTIVQRRVRTPEWRPDAALALAMARGESRIRVVAIHPGDVPGESTDWLRLDFPGDSAESGDGEGSMAPAAGPPDAYLDLPGGPLDLPDAASAEPHPDAASLHRAVGSLLHRPYQDIPGLPSRRADLVLGLTATANSSRVPGPSALSRLQLSSQTDLQWDRFYQQFTGDVSLSHDLDDPWHSRASGESWVARMGLAEGVVRPEAALGYTPPAFVDGSEFLSLFSSGGGVQADVASPIGRVFYYASARLTSAVNPVQPQLKVRAAGYEAASHDGRYLVRGTAHRVTDPADGVFSPGGEGDARGMLARARLHEALELEGELATGEFTPGEGAFDEERKGSAFRLGARGTAGTVGYSAALSRTGAGFVNPGNPGFTAGGVSGRTRAELSLSSAIPGNAMVQGGYTHVRSEAEGSLGQPGVTENGGMLSLSLPVSPQVLVSLSGNLANQSGDPNETLGIQGVDRTQRGFSLSVMETFGGIGLTQSVTRQLSSDRSYPMASYRMTDVQFGAFGSLHRYVNLSGTLSGSRTRGAPEVGSSRHFLASAQLSVAVGTTGLSLTPGASYSRSEGDASGDFRSSQYHLAARWSAPWQAVRLEVEVATDLGRQWEAQLGAPGHDSQTRLTVGLSWPTQRQR